MFLADIRIKVVQFTSMHNKSVTFDPVLKEYISLAPSLLLNAAVFKIIS
jgi:hypothetical protein